jgi:hypothetical protein
MWIKFYVDREHLAALKHSVDEMSELNGTRLSRARSPQREQLLTKASVALGALRAAVNKAVGSSPHIRS